MKAKLLKNVPLFSALPDAELAILAEALSPSSLKQGEWLFFEGDPADRFYMLVEGLVEIVKARGTPDERLLAVRGPNAFIGEMGLLSPEGKRTASVRAQTDLRMYEMTNADFDEILRHQPLLGYELVRVVSSRLQESENGTVRSLREKNAALTRAYEELQAAQAQIVEKQTIERELQMAREIQQNILPHTVPSLRGYEFDARMIPSHTVGGDFFDFVPLGNERVAVAIGDVSDKSIPAAIFMALTRSLVRAEAYRAESPRDVLSSVNRLLLDMNQSGMFVTLLYGVLDAQTRQFDYVRAGHELPVLIEADGWCGMPPPQSGQPLGLLPDPLMQTQRIALPVGTTLVLYTDGVTETMNEHGEPFGAIRLCDTLRELAQSGAQDLCDGLLEALARYRGSTPPHDDIALVAMRGC